MQRRAIRHVLIIPVLGLLCLVAAVVCIGVGSVPLSPTAVLRALFVDDGSDARLLVFSLRLPRVLTGGLVGICLALSGCMLQSMMRNHLASPTTVGVTGGASFVGYLTLVVFPTYAHLLPLCAILGAFATTMLIYLLAYQKGVSPVRMILAGMAVSALFGALNDLVKTAFSDRLGNASGFLVGGLGGTTWDAFFLILPYAVIGGIACLFLPAGMNVLMLGDETASTLGLRTERFRFVLIVLSSLLSGAAISTAGLVSFVGLIVPHIARLLVGSDHRRLLPTSALLGFLLVTVCDTVGRVILPLGEIPVSIILSLLGAPFFLWLLRHRKGGDS